MKHRERILTYLVVALFVGVPLVWAGVTNFDAIKLIAKSADTYQIEVDNSSGTRVFSVDSSGNVYMAGTVTNSRTRPVPLPLAGFTMTGAVPTTLGATTSPTLTHYNGIPAIIPGASVTTPILQTFRVPTDYSSGGIFRVLCSADTSASTVNFDVLINRSGRARTTVAASTYTAQTITQKEGTMTVVDLTMDSVNDAVVAGDWVTVRIWTPAAAGVTAGSLVRFYAVDFYYTATQ